MAKSLGLSEPLMAVTKGMHQLRPSIGVGMLWLLLLAFPHALGTGAPGPHPSWLSSRVRPPHSMADRVLLQVGEALLLHSLQRYES